MILIYAGGRSEFFAAHKMYWKYFLVINFLLYLVMRSRVCKLVMLYCITHVLFSLIKCLDCYISKHYGNSCRFRKLLI